MLRRLIGLGVILLVLGAVVVLRHCADPALQEREQQQRLQLITQLQLPAYDNQPHTDILQITPPSWFVSTQTVVVHRLRAAGQAAGVVLFAVSAQGYSGPIRIAISIDAVGRVRDVRVLEHQETPGIGDAVARPDWLAGFRQRSLHDPAADRWQLRSRGGAFDQLTGATTSAHALIQLVHACLRLYAEQGDDWFAGPAD